MEVERRRDRPFPDQISNKRPKVLSSVGNITGSEQKIQYNRNNYGNNQPGYNPEENTTNATLKSKPELLEVHNRPEIMNRNKRMFGSLVGHLGLAKKKLEDDSELMKRQKDLANSITQKKTAEFMKYTEEKKIIDENESKKKKLEEKINNLKTIAKSTNDRYEHLRKYILTKSEPKMLWLPKNHNNITSKLLENRDKEIDIVLAEIELENAKKIKDLNIQIEGINNNDNSDDNKVELTDKQVNEE